MRNFNALPLFSITDADRSKAEQVRSICEAGAGRYSSPIPLGDKEARRQATFRLLQLSHSPERSFDAVMDLAGQLLPYPLVLITIVEDEMTWSKSQRGLQGNDPSDRNISFCSHVVYREEPMIILDASKDATFATHPLVCGPPNLRFYAGFPLSVNGAVLGAFCVLDLVPHLEVPDELALILARFASTLETMLSDRVTRRLLDSKVLFLHQTTMRNIPPLLADRWSKSMYSPGIAPEALTLADGPVVIEPFFFECRNVAVVVTTYARASGAPMTLDLTARMHALMDVCAEAANVILVTTSDGSTVAVGGVVYSPRSEVGLEGTTSGPVDREATTADLDAQRDALHSAVAYAACFTKHAQQMAAAAGQGPLTTRTAVATGGIYAGATSGPRISVYGVPLAHAVGALSKATDGTIVFAPTAVYVADSIPSVANQRGGAARRGDDRVNDEPLPPACTVKVSDVADVAGPRVEGRVEELLRVQTEIISGTALAVAEASRRVQVRDPGALRSITLSAPGCAPQGASDAEPEGTLVDQAVGGHTDGGGTSAPPAAAPAAQV